MGSGVVDTWRKSSQAFLAFQSFSVASKVGNEGRRQKSLAELLEIPHLFQLPVTGSKIQLLKP